MEGAAATTPPPQSPPLDLPSACLLDASAAPASPKSHLKITRLERKRSLRRAARASYARNSPNSAPSKARKRLIFEKAPSSEEIDDFFLDVERAAAQELARFIERYNFDVVHDAPLQGRYEWIKVSQ